MAAKSDQKMETRIYSPKTLNSLPSLVKNIFKGFVDGRELAWRFFLRDLKVSYTKSLLGALWLFLPPLATAGIWIFLNSRRVVTIPNAPMRYAAFVVCGTMLWSLFAEAIVKPIQRYQSAMGIMTKLNFPRESIALACIYDLTFSFLVKLIILIPLLWIFGYPPTLLFVPAAFAAFLLTMLGFSFGLLLSPMGLLYTDISRGLPIVLPFLMYVCPVIYPMPNSGSLSLLQSFNPVSPFIERARSYMGGYDFNLNTELIYYSAGMIFIFVVSQIIIRIAMPIIIERSGS